MAEQSKSSRSVALDRDIPAHLGLLSRSATPGDSAIEATIVVVFLAVFNESPS